jgi:hypothetical protein
MQNSLAASAKVPQTEKPSLVASIDSCDQHLRDAIEAYGRLCNVFNRVSAPRPCEAETKGADPRAISSALESRIADHDIGVKTLAKDLHELASQFERLI